MTYRPCQFIKEEDGSSVCKFTRFMDEKIFWHTMGFRDLLPIETLEQFYQELEIALRISPSDPWAKSYDARLRELHANVRKLALDAIAGDTKKWKLVRICEWEMLRLIVQYEYETCYMDFSNSAELAQINVNLQALKVE